MKIKAKAKDCRLIVRVKLTFGENLDCMELDRFSRMGLRGFLKPRMVKKNTIEYTGPVGISLYERLKKPISKHDFFFIMEHIVVTMQKIQGNSLFPGKLILDIHNVYINEVTKELQFLYIPKTEPNEDVNVMEFLETIIYSVCPVPEQDTEYISRFTGFIRNLNLLNPEKVERYIYKEDRNVVNTIKKNNAGQSGFITNKRKEHYDYYERKRKKDEADILTDIMDPNEDDTLTGIMDLNEDDMLTDIMDPNEDDILTGIMDPDEDDTLTGIINQNEDDILTGLLIDEEATGYLNEEATGLLVDFPKIVRTLTNETICVNKPVFRIGKEKSYVDYFVSNNDKVSRSHADLITRGNRYYVLDHNSKNRTYVNGIPIPVEYEVEIHDGDRLKLANEEFVFYL